MNPDLVVGGRTGSSHGHAAAILFLLLVLLLCLGNGCALQLRSPGEELLHRGDYAAAVAALAAEEARRPGDIQVKRTLGIALQRAGLADSAVAVLSEVARLDPDNVQTLFFLAAALEEDGQLEQARDTYASYLSRGGKGSPEVRMRLRSLSTKIASLEIRRALEDEETLTQVPPPDSTLAVLEFANTSASERLAPLSKGIAALMITDLTKVHRLRILERGHLGDLLRELHLAESKVAVTQAAWDPLETTEGIKQRLQALRRLDSAAPYFDGAIDDTRDPAFFDAVRAFQRDRNLGADGKPGPLTQAAVQSAVDDAKPSAPSTPARYVNLVDSTSAPRLGRLIGTRRFVKGAFVVSGKSEIQLDAFLLDAVTKEQTPVGSSVVGNLPDLIHLEKDLVFQTIKALGIEPTEEERLALGRVPTESFPALLAYSMGLALEDEGRTQEALQSYREAVGYDPAFEPAEEAKEILETSPTEQVRIERAELEATIQPQETTGSDDIARDMLPIIGVGPVPLDPAGSPSDGRGQGDDQSPTDVSKPEEGGEPLPYFPPPPGER